ncbi:MAG: glycosyltransferase family 4 protein [Pseudoxanthomonas sp.]
MRIVYDMQPCMTESRDRGIGRYAENLASAMVAQAERDSTIDSIIAMDGIDSERLRDARTRFRHHGIAAPTAVYTYPASVFTDIEPERSRAAASVKGRFFESLSPDVHLQFSYFETGFNYSTGVDWLDRETPHKAAIAYDLIPLIFPDRYLSDRFIAEWYSRKCESFKRLDMLLAISESTRADLVRYLQVPEEKIRVIGTGLDPGLLAASLLPTSGDDRLLRKLGIRESFVLVVSNGDWRKNTLGAVQDFARLPASIRNHHQLVLTKVGDDVMHALAGPLRSVADRVLILNRVDDRTLSELYRRCAVFYFPSLYEGFGLPVLEAMAFGAPVLSSNRGALPEVIHDTRCLFDPTDNEASVKSLARVLDDREFSDALRSGAVAHAHTFTWDKCARAALDALGELNAIANPGSMKLEKEPGSRLVEVQDRDLAIWADFIRGSSAEELQALERDLQAVAARGRRRILVDVTCIAEFDPRSGIQRVVRNFCASLHDLASESGRFEVQPIYWTAEHGIRYANEFARDSLGLVLAGEDLPVEPRNNDLLFMLDSAWAAPERFEPLYEAVWRQGGEVVWMVYDLIPVLIPHTCHEGMPPAFSHWLSHSVRHADGFICISEATRHDLERYIDQHAGFTRRPWTRSVHLGSDLDPGRIGLPTQNMTRLVETLQKTPILLAIGTVEPRKDHVTILASLERLWSQGKDAALVIIGKPGWNVEELSHRIASHPENNKRLIWLKNASDADLALLLDNTTALIQASISEGFGLPIVEAGSKGVPLLLSDIAVFREIAGDAASYFPAGDHVALAELISGGLKEGFLRPGQGRIVTKTWREVSNDLADRLLS